MPSHRRDARVDALITELRKRQGRLSEDDAAGLIFRSRRRLRAIVLESTGLSYRKLRLLIKLECAGTLLLQTTLTVREISRRLCYGSPRKFVDSFKRENGLTPTEFRLVHLLLKLNLPKRFAQKTATQGHSTVPSSGFSIPPQRIRL